jgi:GH25 family lysozyme M1 (1,4-beta-N-acetylmuramidase)/transcription initiation factor IIF auxiliary subunit
MKKLMKIIMICLLVSITCFLRQTFASSIQSKIYIDLPNQNQELVNGVYIQGWVMSDDANAKVEVSIDNNSVDIERYERPDVLSAFSNNFGGSSTNSKPGFRANVDTSSYSYGTHTVKVVVKDENDNIINEQTRQFNKKRPASMIYIDLPNQNQELVNGVYIQGWVMSDDANAKVEVSIDNNSVDIERYERPDVLSAFSNNFGGSSTNSKPGFRANVDTSSYSYGTHTVKVVVKDENDNIINEQTRQFNKKRPASMIYIDLPNQNQELVNGVYIQGWVMSDDANAKVEVSIDNNSVDIERYERPDVLSAFSNNFGGSSTNSKPGFRANVDTSSYSYGTHTVKVVVKDENDNIINEQTRQFNKKRPASMIYIDLPNQNQELVNGVYIQGWVMSDDANAKVEVSIDNNSVDIERYERPDVLSAFSNNFGGSSTNSKPGFRANVDTSSYSYGTHTVKVVVKDENDNIINEQTRQFNKKRPASMIYIDLPNQNQELVNGVYIQGWVMSDDANAKVEVSIDNNSVDIERYERPDVLSAFSNNFGGSSTNSKPGFRANVDTSSYSYGTHTVKVVVKDENDNIINEQTRTFLINIPTTMLNFNDPNTDITYNGNVSVRGWYLADEPNTTAEVYVNGIKIDTSIEERSDVFDVYKDAFGGIANTPKPGFRATFNVRDLVIPDGKAVITINIVSTTRKENISSYTTTISVKKYDGKLYLDYPQVGLISSNSTPLLIQGWEMSELDNSYIKIYLNDVEQDLSINRYERSDAINAITGYGDASVNATPGFSTNLDIINLAEGTYKITIKLYSKLNELLTSYDKYIMISKGVYNGIDVSSYNNVNSWSGVKSAGIDYAIIRAAVRGYGINSLGIDGNLVQDSKFYTNVSNATSAGIKVGAYVYSQAVTELEAVQEANLAIQMIAQAGGKSKVTLPIVFDTEFSGCWESGVRCGRADNLSTADRTKIAKAFLDTITGQGYTPMIYASTSFLNNQLDMSQLASYKVWVAHYDVNIPSYKGAYQIWQYTSNGSLSDISGNVDMNYVYEKY